MAARLVDPTNEIEYPLVDGANAIGRRAENDVCLPGGAVSRFHAEIRLEEGAWVIEDQGSTYGTYVNGEKAEGAVPVADADSVRFGVTPELPRGEYNLVFREGPAAVPRGGVPVRRGQIEDGRAEIEHVGGVAVARLSGVFRKNEIDALATELRRELRAGARLAVLDLRRVSSMNSYSLSVLVDLASAYVDAGARLRAFGAEGSVRKLLGLAGAANPMELCSSEAEALGGD